MPDSSVMAVVVLVVVMGGLALLIRPYFRQKRERTEQLRVIAGKRGWALAKERGKGERGRGKGSG